MVRQSKSTTTTPVPVVAAAPVAVSVTVEASTPVEKKPRKTKAASATAPVVEVAAPVVEVAAPVVDAPVVAPAVETDASILSSKLNDFGAKILQIATLLASMKTDYKVLEKCVAREVKQKSSKSSRKAKAALSGNRKPSGFVKPTAITEELSRFLGKEVGVMMSRVEVSKEITKYINENSLKDKDCGRQINPDAKLSKLLNITAGGEVLTFFNLQKYLKVHFVKDVAPVVV